MQQKHKGNKFENQMTTSKDIVCPRERGPGNAREGTEEEISRHACKKKPGEPQKKIEACLWTQSPASLKNQIPPKLWQSTRPLSNSNNYFFGRVAVGGCGATLPRKKKEKKAKTAISRATSAGNRASQERLPQKGLVLFEIWKILKR